MIEPPRDGRPPAPQPHRPRPHPEGWVPSVEEEPPARRRSARTAVAVAGVVVLLLAVLVVVLAMTLGPTVLDRAAVERDVAAQFEAVHGVSVKLDCPDEMRVASGEEYSCSGTTSAGEEIRLAIQIGDELNGDYTWTEVRGGG